MELLIDGTKGIPFHREAALGGLQHQKILSTRAIRRCETGTLSATRSNEIVGRILIVEIVDIHESASQIEMVAGHFAADYLQYFESNCRIRLQGIRHRRRMDETLCRNPHDDVRLLHNFLWRNRRPSATGKHGCGAGQGYDAGRRDCDPEVQGSLLTLREFADARIKENHGPSEVAAAAGHWSFGFPVRESI